MSKAMHKQEELGDLPYSTKHPLHLSELHKYHQRGRISNKANDRILPKSPQFFITNHPKKTPAARTSALRDSHLQLHSRTKTSLSDQKPNSFTSTHKSFYCIIYKNKSRSHQLKYPLIASKYSTAKIYLPMRRPKQMRWEPHCVRSISTVSIVPNQCVNDQHHSLSKKPSLSFSSKNLLNRPMRCFAYAELNDELIRTDQRRKCIYKKRRYLQDYGLAMIKIVYQINRLITVIEPFSSSSMSVYLIFITEEDNLSSFVFAFSSFDKFIASLRYDDDHFIINRTIKEFTYSAQSLTKEEYSSSQLEKDLITLE